MIINNKIQKGKKLVKSIIFDVDYLKFTSKYPRYYGNYNLHTKFCVVVPFDHYHIYIEVAKLDSKNKVHFNIRGFLDINTLAFNSYLDLSYASVGELTLHEKFIVNFNEVLRIYITGGAILHPIRFDDNLDLSDLEIFCNQALNLYLCNRIYLLDKKFYVLDDLGMN